MSIISFRQRVYTIAQQIPKGKVATYGQLAKMAGSPRAARAVGMSMKCNPDASIIPCHRVVASNGRLVGYAFGGIQTKKQKLLNEGVAFIKDTVDLNVSQWRVTI
ncbi:MGMT family protein [Candidatus Parcubacteria bacterium]|nr:MGMT family protein [Candidatus Parcubacteria bacterium]